MLSAPILLDSLTPNYRRMIFSSSVNAGAPTFIDATAILKQRENPAVYRVDERNMRLIRTPEADGFWGRP